MAKHTSKRTRSSKRKITKTTRATVSDAQRALSKDAHRVLTKYIEAGGRQVKDTIALLLKIFENQKLASALATASVLPASKGVRSVRRGFQQAPMHSRRSKKSSTRSTSARSSRRKRTTAATRSRSRRTASRKTVRSKR